MELNSISFLVFAIGVIIASHCFPSARGRRVVLALASAIFIGSYASDAAQLAPLLLFLLLCFSTVRIVQLHPSRIALSVGLLLILSCFVYLKKFSFVDGLPVLPFAYLTIGLSYILFRVIHLAVDASQGELRERISPVMFFGYTCNFLSFVSGPIQRYQDFVETSQKHLQLDDEKVFAAFSRVVRGFFKVAVVSAIANHLFELMSVRLLEHGSELPMLNVAVLFAVTATVYAIYLYYNFSGYMDIVIGIGWLIGYELPENFNQPFRSRNFLEFWSRWHITLSEWFKLYVFNPLMKILAARIENTAAQPVLGVIAYFLTFLLMGMWHGTTAVFLLYGLAMGVGASANKLWQIGMTRYLGRKRYKALSENVIYATLCTGMTCAWFVLALTCFWVEMPQVKFLMQSLGLRGALLTFCGLAVAAGVVLRLADYFSRHVTSAISLFAIHARGLVVRNLMLGAHVLVITCVASFFHKAPEFVYRTF